MLREYRTLIKTISTIADESYVRGRISGYHDVFCKNNALREGLVNVKIAEGLVLRSKCTSEEYEKFREFTESRYPGICVFDYQE